MGTCVQWMDDKLKRLRCFDYYILKVSVTAFTLLTAKFWPNILSLDWYWYGAVFVVTFAYLMVKILRK